MYKVAIIIPCKGRTSHLMECLKSIPAHPKRWELDIYVVNYDCPDDWAEVRGLGINFTELKVEDRPNFNLSEARNIGISYANSQKSYNFFLILDADAILLPLFWQENRPCQHSFCCGWGAGIATGSCYVPFDALLKVRGYNELMQGWGFEDIDLYNRLKSYGLELKPWAADTISEISHEDDIRTEYYSTVDKWATNEKNAEIRDFKSCIA